jgi:urease accessory protein
MPTSNNSGRDLVEVRAADLDALLRLAWAIGNRHRPAELGPDFIIVERDPGVEEMIVGLGGTMQVVARPFHPEGGAYAAAGGGDG